MLVNTHLPPMLDTCGSGLQPCVESLLDIEYLGAITAPIPMTDIYSSTCKHVYIHTYIVRFLVVKYPIAFADSLQAWMNTILGLSNPPLVHSVSYGNDEVQQTSSAYMTAVDQQFQQAAAIGLSILFASGMSRSMTYMAADCCMSVIHVCMYR